MLWGDRADAKCCLLIWLIEAGIHATSIAGFELGVEIDLVVGRINETVQAFTRV